MVGAVVCCVPRLFGDTRAKGKVFVRGKEEKKQKATGGGARLERSRQDRRRRRGRQIHPRKRGETLGGRGDRGEARGKVLETLCGDRGELSWSGDAKR